MKRKHADIECFAIIRAKVKTFHVDKGDVCSIEVEFANGKKFRIPKGNLLNIEEVFVAAE